MKLGFLFFLPSLVSTKRLCSFIPDTQEQTQEQSSFHDPIPSPASEFFGSSNLSLLLPLLVWGWWQLILPVVTLRSFILFLLVTSNAAHIIMKSQLPCLSLLSTSFQDLNQIHAVTDSYSTGPGAALLLELCLNCRLAVFVTPGSFVGKQTLRFCLRLLESETAFSQDFQVILSVP